MKSLRPTIVGLGCVALGWSVTWLISAQPSPLFSYAHTRDWPGDFWFLFNFVPLFLTTRVCPEPGTTARMIAGIVFGSSWWFGIGFGLAAGLAKLTFRRRELA